MDAEAIRAVSRALFGNRYLLEVAAAIDDLTQEGEPVVYSRQIAKRLAGPADNQVLQAVHKIAAGGLLVPIEEKFDTRASRYSVVPSTYWQLATTLLDELRAQPAPLGPPSL